jgi:hypothetical protein
VTLALQGAGLQSLGAAAVARYLNVPTASGASTPDQAGLAGGANTLDLRVEMAPTDWASGNYQAVISQDNNASGARWWVGITPTGEIETLMHAIGADISAPSTVATGFADGASRGVRVLRTPSAGTVDFYTSEDFSTWTPLGSQITGTSTNPMAIAGTAPAVQVGTDVYAEPMLGKITRVMVLVNGATILNWDITTAALGNGPWVAGSGETWTRIGTASVTA